ncbi:MAG: hypothetical protein JWP48_1341 [Actinoallomurus sp.]|nr:hypothetical protein [Actinoallomurus sp.]
MITALSYHAPQISGRKKKADSGDRPGLDEIRVETKAGTRTLAYVENDTADDPAERPRSDGARCITLWEDAHRSRRLAGITTKSASKRYGTDYAIWGAAGEPLGTVRLDKTSLSEPQRTRWTIQQADVPPMVGVKGKIGWWWAWWLLSPLWLLIIVGSFLAGGGDIARMPRSVEWRLRDETVLRFAAGSEEYQVFASWLEPPIAAAVVALHHSHPGPLA